MAQKPSGSFLCKTHGWHIEFHCPACPKPDATPREWKLRPVKDESGLRLALVVGLYNFEDMTPVIEKSAYLELSASMCRVLDGNHALKQRVAESNERAEHFETLSRRQLRALADAKTSLSFAEQDRDSWKQQHKILQDAANGRIKELNEQCMAMANERLDQEWPVVKQLHAAEEREQKLVAALETLKQRWYKVGAAKTISYGIVESALAEHKGGGLND